ncbi:MAG TPA: beta-N-acetylhexosaminidase [Azospira sp.]|nr:beta-N-acetylhexosaminidase [Azospira sp.]
MTQVATLLPLGPLMIDIAGTELTDLDRQRLSHPAVGGIILFARNYRCPEQLDRLCAEIHELRTPRLPIAIDHEGGRVQRCREGFTRLPAMRSLGQVWEADPARAREMASAIGYVLAAELRLHGVDLSFTPVLDLDWGRSSVVGTRAFHRDPEIVAALAGALIDGLRQAGMVACGKHFPGHGWVEADSHVAIPVDERTPAELASDILPYRRLQLEAVMPAHVSYPQIDSNSAGFSNYWINFLRNNIKFDGVVFSDDLSMEGASVAGDIVARATAAYRAGCDMLLVCNSPDSVGELLARWSEPLDPVRSARIERLLPTSPAPTRALLQDDPRYRAGVAYAGELLAAA